MDSGPARLGRYVLRDRSRTFRSQKAFAAAAGLSARTVSRIEDGVPMRYHVTTKGRVESALNWTDGSFDRVLAGGRPTYAKDPMLDELIRLWAELSGDARAMLLRLARDALDRNGGP